LIKNPRELRKASKRPACFALRGLTRKRGTEKPLPRRHRGKRRPGERARCVRRRLARGSQPCPHPAVTPSPQALEGKSVGNRKVRRLASQYYKDIDRIFAKEDRLHAKIASLKIQLRDPRGLNAGVRVLARRLREQGEILRKIHTFQTKTLGKPPIPIHVLPDGSVMKFSATGRDGGRTEEKDRRDGEGHCPICSYLTLEVEKHLRKKHAAKGRAMADAMFGAMSREASNRFVGRPPNGDLTPPRKGSTRYLPPLGVSSRRGFTTPRNEDGSSHRTTRGVKGRRRVT